jgi:hypothetical protein
MRWLRATLVLVTLTPPAHAQQPILRVAIDPPRVVVGQSTILRLDVLVPNYMTGAPVLPDFQLRNAVTRALKTINATEQHDGVTYAGVRYAFAIHPQEPGAYAIADRKITVRFAADPPATREATVAVPPVAFEAFIPDAAAGLDPFLAANRLTIEQAVQQSSDPLQVGDSVTRTVTIRVDGLPAMSLPPVRFAAPEGLALYPAQPRLEEKSESRTDELSATRIDAATYMAERAGDYRLPEIELRWWNLRAQRIERARLDAVSFAVAASPQPAAAPESGGVPALVEWLLRHWPAMALATAAAVALGFVSRPAAIAIGAWYRRRREAWLRSEACAFRRLRAAARTGDANAVYDALIGWIERFDPAAPDRTIGSLTTATGDRLLAAEIEALERRLFAPPSFTAGWSPRMLMRRVRAVRRRPLARPARAAHALPPALNPTAPAPARRRPRAVAR